MIPIEKQVVSLELAKELEANGYEQEGLFARTLDTGQIVPNPDMKELPNWVTAPTVAEMGEALPKHLYIVSGAYDDNLWWCGIRRAEVSLKDDDTIQRLFEEDIEFVEESEANARAKMYLYLHKEGLL